MESKEYVNPFIDVHRKAEALKKRAREEHDKEGELREQKSQAATRALDARMQASSNPVILKSGVVTEMRRRLPTGDIALKST
jgi:hypothetical protein